MRIAIVYDAVYPYVAGGAERRYFEIGRRLAARGHSVRLVGWQYWDGPAVQRRDGVTLHGVGRPKAFHNGDGRRTFSEALSFALRAAPAVASVDADVIECSSIPYVPTLLSAVVTRARRVPLVVSWHEYMGERWNEYDPRRAWIARRVEDASARCGDLRVAVSEFTKSRLPRGPRTAVIPNGVDCRAIAGVRAKRSAPDVITIGRLVPHKRVDLLLQALALAPELSGGVIGDGPEKARLEQLARGLGVDGRVRFYGRVASDNDVYALVKGARVLLAPSEQEGFGMTIVEAQGAGTPAIVVRSRHSAASDLVQHERNGLLVEPEPQAIGDALLRVAGDRVFRSALSRNARASAARFDWEQVTDRTEEAYARLIDEPITAQELVEQVA
jgi:glycosyltransferase involved in cell wall biosynthesis